MRRTSGAVIPAKIQPAAGLDESDVIERLKHSQHQERLAHTLDAVAQFARAQDPCCAGCDHWDPINSVVGECSLSPPVSAAERGSMLGMSGCSAPMQAGHLLTHRAHTCGAWLSVATP